MFKIDPERNALNIIEGLNRLQLRVRPSLAIKDAGVALVLVSIGLGLTYGLDFILFKGAKPLFFTLFSGIIFSAPLIWLGVVIIIQGRTFVDPYKKLTRALFIPTSALLGCLFFIPFLINLPLLMSSDYVMLFVFGNLPVAVLASRFLRINFERRDDHLIIGAPLTLKHSVQVSVPIADILNSNIKSFKNGDTFQLGDAFKFRALSTQEAFLLLGKLKALCRDETRINETNIELDFKNMEEKIVESEVEIQSIEVL